VVCFQISPPQIWAPVCFGDRWSLRGLRWCWCLGWACSDSGLFAAGVEFASVGVRMREDSASAVSVTSHAVGAGAGARGFPPLSCL
jgi:hypothetical protein